MASLREFRKKIKTVKSTQQITKAMKMVSAARLRRAQARIMAARPFAIRMNELLKDLAGRLAMDEKKMAASAPHPLLEAHQNNKVALLLVTSDKGLCGSFNTNLVRRAAEYVRDHQDKDLRFFVVGRKGRDFFKRSGYPITGEYTQIFNTLSYTHAEIIGKDLIELFLKEQLSEVVVIYNEFKSVIQQKLTVERLLPVHRPEDKTPESGTTRTSGAEVDFLYEPDRDKLLEALLPRYVKSQIYRILLESFASELGARMSAMDSATKNAKELIDMLTLKLNRQRQAVITREIAELVGGAEALKN